MPSFSPSLAATSANALQEKGVLDSPTSRDEHLTGSANDNGNEVVDVWANSDDFWHQGDIDTLRWDKSYPYQLLVLKAIQNETKTSYQIAKGWHYTLPIPPEALAYSMPFAITTNITQGGVIEEHNGAPVRMIQFQGTTGFLPGRASPERLPGLNLAEAIAGGTMTAAREVSAAVGSLESSFLGRSLQSTNVHSSNEFKTSGNVITNSDTSVLAKSTGYYQFRQLKRFLEGYAAAKKLRQNRNLRLAVAMWKDQAVYLVTPVTFDVRKAGDSPFEYRYSLSFKAWRRVELEVGDFSTHLETPTRRSPNKLARFLNTLQDSRRVLQGVSGVAAAALGDVDRVLFEPLRETVLLAKDLLGAALTVADLPNAIVARLKPSAILAAQNEEFLAISNAVNNKVRGQGVKMRLAANEDSVLTGSNDQVKKQRLLASHPAVKAFDNPKKNYEAMNALDISVMKVPPAVTQQINKERQRVRSLTRRDFETRRDAISRTAGQLAVALGAGNATYENTYNINVTKIKAVPTDSDWEALFALENVVTVMDAMAATDNNSPTAREEAIEVMAALHRRSGTAFQVPRSKYAVPLPYGVTLEELAKQYLGDPNRWPEIAALNGLREPYIDEVGFDYGLTVNGAASQVVVPESENVYVGQVVYIWSNAARRTRRRVVALRRIDGKHVVTVDGDPTMGAYKVKDGAKLSAFLPDTINSQQLVYIPSDIDPADENFLTKSIPGVDEFDPMVAVGAVDLLLDSNNDLVVTPDGDTRWAAGLTNIIQNVRIALSVHRGSLLGHDDYGLPLRVGASTADFDAKEVLDAVRRMLGSDPSFSRVDAVQVVKNGPTASINVAVVVSGTEKPVPVSFKVR